MADQTRRNAVEDRPQDEAAARGDQDPSLLIVGCLSSRQGLERSALDLDAAVAELQHKKL
jgi:carbonic anhydrase